MSDLNDIVTVSISSETRLPTRDGFGIAAFMSYHTVFTDLFRAYSNTADMLTDGFSATHDAYLWAAKQFAQNPSPTQVIIGRLPSAPAFTTAVTITSAVAGDHIKLKVREPVTGTIDSLDYTVLASATTTTVATAVELLTEALPGVDSTSSSAVVTLTPTVAGRKVHVYDCVNCSVEETTNATTLYSDAFAALYVATQEFYFVHADSVSQTTIADIAAWALANGRRYGFSTNSSAAKAGTATYPASNQRWLGIWTPRTHEYASGSWTAMGGPRQPGSVNWAWKELPGVTPAALTTTERNAIIALNLNVYETIHGVNVTRYGVTGAGTFIDVEHGIDALKSDIQETVFFCFVNSAKIPYTTAGFEILGANILAAMRRFEGSKDVPGLIAQGTSRVVMPTVASQSANNKLTRRITGIKFYGTLEGAVNGVTIDGNLSI